MRKSLLRYSLLLLTMLVGVVTSAMAETVTLQYTGTTTTNMSGKNDAALLGLDETEWLVEGDKGQNSNFPGLNKDGSIRLYWGNGGSNTFTVTSLTGATIDNITIYYIAGRTAGSYVEVGGQKVNGTELESVSDAYSYSINSSSFVVGNNYPSNVQVHFSKIEISYTAGTGYVVPVPVISGETPFSYETTVSISVESTGTAGFDIRYTTDGTDPLLPSWRTARGCYKGQDTCNSKVRWWTVRAAGSICQRKQCLYRRATDRLWYHGISG